MRTKRKTEEKKMSMNKNIARLAVTAGLTAALSFGGVMAPVTMAFAEGTPTVATEMGKVFITDPIAEYADTSFKGIQIFTAKITQNKDGNTWSGDKTLSDIQWAPGNVKTLVTTALEKVTGAPDVNADAQTWAEFINQAQGSNVGKKTAVDNGTVLDLIAEALEGDKTLAWTKPSNSSKGKFENLKHGYWLFVTDAPSRTNGNNGNTDAYTSPIFTIVGGSDVNVAPKKSVPTVEKKILDDKNAKDNLTTVPVNVWDDVADSQIGQEVNYKLTGTIADNYATYDSYAYKFTDELSSGLDYVDKSVKVFAFDGTNYAPINSDKYVVTYSGNKLTVEFGVGEGKKGLKDVEGVNASIKIVVFYKAKLNSNAVIGNAKDESGNLKKGGNLNTVTLEYSNNPYGVDKGETIGDTVADFAFKLNLKKVDQGTEKGLPGAVFTIQSADKNTENQYIASTKGTVDGVSVDAGQLVTVTDTKNLPECVKFTSGNDGKIVVSGLDAGSYKVTEIQTPDPAKYPTTADPFTFTIDPKYDKTSMKVKNLAATVSETGRTDIAVGELDNSAGDNKLTGTQNGIDGATGLVTITVGNTKSVGLPLTGLNGVTFTWIAGGAVLCIGVAHLIRSRKQAEESEQE